MPLLFKGKKVKNELVTVLGLNEDLLDIKLNYFDMNGMFGIAVDENNRVIGRIGGI